MKSRHLPDLLLDVLPTDGPSGAVSARHLAAMLNAPRRSISMAVQHLRLHGVPIVSSTEGYWLASGLDDLPQLRQCCRSLRRRIREQTQTVEALEKSMTKMGNENHG